MDSLTVEQYYDKISVNLGTQALLSYIKEGKTYYGKDAICKIIKDYIKYKNEITKHNIKTSILEKELSIGTRYRAQYNKTNPISTITEFMKKNGLNDEDIINNITYPVEITR